MNSTPLLPLFVSIKDQSCLVVGAGPIALRKLRTLRRAGARITVVAPDATPALAGEIGNGEIRVVDRDFRDADIDGHVLVVAATDSRAVNRRIAALARDRGIPVNVVNAPRLGNVMFPSVIHRGPVAIAVSTGGSSPALARWLRTHLEIMIPERFGELAALIGDYRDAVKRKYPGTRDRMRFWERALHGQLSEFLFHSQVRRAAGMLDHYLQLDPEETPTGEVYLVGAGPGDPDLLTFRALRLIQQADIVLYDRLVSPQILELIPRRATRVYVGKARSDHSVPQDQINQRLIDYAREGQRVLRLKGGDPFVFGRGGEEIDGLARARIPFQVVPGITAANGCAAYAGIPLTHRDHAHSCIFVTGHGRDGRLDLNWESLVQPGQTIVVYMGLSGLDTLCRELIARGMPADMPAALIESGTTRDQRVIAAALSELPETVERAGASAPTLVIIGQVVTLRDRLGWFHPQADHRDTTTGTPASD